MPTTIEVEPQMNASSSSLFATIRTTAKRLGIGDKPLREAEKNGDLALYSFGTSRGLLYWPDVVAWALSTKRSAPASEPKSAPDEWASSKLRAEPEECYAGDDD